LDGNLAQHIPVGRFDGGGPGRSGRGLHAPCFGLVALESARRERERDDGRQFDAGGDDEPRVRLLTSPMRP